MRLFKNEIVTIMNIHRPKHFCITRDVVKAEYYTNEQASHIESKLRSKGDNRVVHGDCRIACYVSE